MLRSSSVPSPGSSRKAHDALRRACRGAVASLEPLETRRLLSAINWVNKGTGAGAGDTDSFNAVYGASASLARSIVQRAIDEWERVVPTLNGAGGRNSIDLTVNAAALAGTSGLETTAITYDALGKPDTATFRLDDNGGGFGWYFDGTPGTAAVPDDADFINFVSPFAAERVDSGLDFYRYAARGVGFALGMAASSAALSAVTTDVGDDPNSTDPADRLLAVDIGSNGSTDYTLTTSGGRNLFEGGGSYAGPVHPHEILNSSRVLPTSVVHRQLISDTSAELLRDVYGYTIALPSTINTFYANLDTVTNVVTVTGDMDPTGDEADNIDLEVTDSLTAMSFEANGTDEVIEGAQFTSIVVNAGDAGDDIDVDELLAGKFVTVNGQAGNDTIQIAPEFGDIGNDLLSDVTVDGGINTDTLTFNDTNDPAGNDTYTFFTPTVAAGSRIIFHSDMEHLELTGSHEASVYNINGTLSSYTLDIVASGATDTFNVGDGDYDTKIDGDISIDALVGGDVLNIDDEDDTGTGAYTLTHLAFNKTAGGTLSFDSIAQVIVNGSDQGSVYNVDIGGATVDAVTVNAGPGADTLDLGGVSNDIDNALAADITFNGQGGADRVDLNDAGDSADAEDYNLTGTTLAKDGTSNTLTFNGTELIDLRANDGANTITVEYGFLLPGQSVTVGGGGGDDEITSLAIGAVTAMPSDANVTLQGGAGTDTVTLDDSAGLGDLYTITADTFQAANPGNTTGLINYTAENFHLRTSMIASQIRVDGTAAGTAYDIDAEAGDDTFRFGGPARDVRNLLGMVTARGGAGTDRLNYNDDGHASGAEYRLTLTFIGHSGAEEVVVTSIEQTDFHASDGADVIDLEGSIAGTTATINGHAGDDAINVGFVQWDGAVRGDATINGNAGADALVINDANDTGNDNYNITATQATSTGLSSPGTIDYATVESLTLLANQGANVITVSSTFAGDVHVKGGTGADQVEVVDHFAGRPVHVDGGAGLDQVRANFDGVGAASVAFDNSQDLSNLTLGAGGSASIAAGSLSTLFTQSLNMPSGTTLDLTDNQMVLDYTGPSPINGIIAILIGAYNGGAWNGPGINSSVAAANPSLSTAVGYAEATNLFATFPANVGGFAVDNTALLLKHTFYGDANLDGNVNLGDFNRLAANFGLTTGARWGQGNFDFNGNVNLSDFNKLAANFGQPGAAPDITGGGEDETLPSIEDLLHRGRASAGGRGATRGV